MQSKIGNIFDTTCSFLNGRRQQNFYPLYRIFMFGHSKIIKFLPEGPAIITKGDLTQHYPYPFLNDVSTIVSDNALPIENYCYQ
jgi:hypothetical protein